MCSDARRYCLFANLMRLNSVPASTESLQILISLLMDNLAIGAFNIFASMDSH